MVCQDVANKWKDSNDFSYLKLIAIVMIIPRKNYIFDQKVDDLLGVYMEYALNEDYLMICKWTNQMNAENLNDTNYIRN